MQKNIKDVTLKILLIIIFNCLPTYTADETKPISVVLLKNTSPVSYVNEKGEPDGLYTHLIDEIAKQSNQTVKFVVTTWAEGLELVKSGEVDLMPAVIKTEEREKVLDFNNISVMISWGTLVIHKDSSIVDISCIAGKTVGIVENDQNGENFLKLIKELNVQCSTRVFSKHQSVKKLVENGELYAGVFFNSYDLYNSDLKHTSIVFSPVTSFFATAKNKNALLLKKIDQQIALWKSDKNSYYYEYVEEHLTNSKKASIKIHKWVIVSLFSMTILAIFVIIWAVTLKVAIKKKTNDLKMFNERMSRTQKMNAMGQMAGGIAHDFNNVLGAIIGFTELSLEQVSKDSNVYRYLTGIKKGGARAKDLVAQILTFSRQEEEKLLPLNLKPIIMELMEMLKATIPSSVELVNNYESESSPVLADATKIHEVIMNLSMNAVHAMEEKGTLTIHLREKRVDRALSGIIDTITPGNYTVIEVSDTGSGMSKEQLLKVFEPFYTTKVEGHGTGLGLSVVYGIMRSHKGDIQVESNLGVGTKFKLFFPKTDITVDKKNKNDMPVYRGTENILIVDDEELLVEMNSILFSDLGYNVTTCTDSLEALKLFKANPSAFDALITDQTMPNLTGDELSKEILQINRNFPIILCTGFSSKINERITKSIGIKRFFKKPIDKNELAKAVREVL